MSSSGYLPALQPYPGSSVSTPSARVSLLQVQRRRPPIWHWEPNLDDLEVSFLRTVSRIKIPIAASEDVQLDSIDRRFDLQSRHGTTMQVHRGTWKDRRVAFKYIRRSWFPEDRSGLPETSDKEEESSLAWRQDMYDLNFELQIMSKPTLRSHPNITQLLGVCFSTSLATSTFAEPGLIVELAHEQYPDLASFFDLANNLTRPHHLPFSTTASLICDIADGIQILHDHDLVHADLKPGNILLFPSSTSTCGLTAKISDFGLLGMTTYTASGVRAPLPDGRPRGGTPEWNAPECLREIDPLRNTNARYTLDYPQYKPGRDIYAFGLLATYIALDGQSPHQVVDGNLGEVKLADEMQGAVVIRIGEYYSTTGEIEGEKSLRSSAIAIALATLSIDPEKRTKSLRALKLRELLLDDTTSPTTWPVELFVLAHNLFPNAHEFKCSGFHDAYWASPENFRKRVYASFVKLEQGKHGMLGQLVEKGVWEGLENPAM